MEDRDNEHSHDPVVADTDVAIIGMSGHFPGAPDVDRLWERVERGDDCLVDLDPRQLISEGWSADVVRSPDRVLRAGVIDGVADFDRNFFGFSARDAAVMDPQHRHFLECAWEALESAAHSPERFDGPIGVFAGSGMNTYLLHNLLSNPQLVEDLGWFLLRHTGNDKDFLTTTLSYKLDLQGPSVNVQTACSTSLVAVHLAAQSLLSFECDMALAGGVTIEFPHAVGYEYREGEILSPSGRCRAFDARSEGTVLTGGAAVVVLRRMADAIADRDPILAVIKGSAINNDGSRKVGYLAPSVDGHADVVREALAVADVDARSIGLLEAHGTGTAVGDPIEVAALTEAFRAQTDDSSFCRLVSTKPNIGHLDTAAGAASLIKVVQALRHRCLPPLANHTGASPLLDLEHSPFTLSGEAAPWETDGPRRAGVSSLGVGGTNAHVVVEEAPVPAATPAAAPGQIIALSGLTTQAVDDATERLAAFLAANPTTNLADVSHTLIAGRRHMPVRRVITVTDSLDAPDELRTNDRRRRPTATIADAPPRVAFTFPGGGAQYVGMGAHLDPRFDVFHAVRQEGVELARRLGGLDLAALFAPDADPEALERATASLPAVFVTSVALARQWMAWGVEPDALIGHSLGEYVAAHLAGVMSFEDALSLVITRSQLMERVSGSGGAMLVVPLPESDVSPTLPTELSIATVNAADECVVAGAQAVIDELSAHLTARGIEAVRLPLSAAAHSSLLDPVLGEFATAVASIQLHPPQRRYVSNLTGDWITSDQATDPQYWVDHLRRTVRFADGLQTLLGERPTVLVELGPGTSLSSYARRTGLAAGTISALRHPDDPVSDTNHSLNAFAQLWTHGIDVDLDRFAGDGRRRLRLPTYPFQRERCWIEPGTASSLGLAHASTRQAPAELTRLTDLDAMIWRQRWIDAPAPARNQLVDSWLVVGDDAAAELVDELTRRGRTVRHLRTFTGDELDGATGVVVVGRRGSTFSEHRSLWLEAAPALARSLGRQAEPARLVIVTDGCWSVDGEANDPGAAMALGVTLVAPHEYPDLTTAMVDVDRETTVAQLADEIESAVGVVARRGGRRVMPRLDPAPEITEAAETSGFVRGGTYLITGALGGIGVELAEHLARDLQAHLVVVTSEPIPAPSDRDRHLGRHAFDHPTTRRIRRLERISRSGESKVEVVIADLADPQSIRGALDEAERRVGHLDGVIHAAGTLRDQLLETASYADHRHVVDPKAGAAIMLADELERRGVPLLALVSSTSTTLAPAGQTAYVAANSVLDALAGRRGRLRIATIGFGVWAGTGMAAEVARRQRLHLPTGSPVAHPVLGELIESPDGQVILTGRIATTHHWMADEHRTDDHVAVVPGTGQIELLLAAARELDGAGATENGRSGPLQLDRVALFEPLIVPDDIAVTVRVVADTEVDGRRAVRLESDGGAGTWLTHAEATIGASVLEPTTLAEAEIARRCPLGGVEPMAAVARHLDLGSRWHPTTDASLGDGESFGHVRLAESVSEECEWWLAHPAVVDVATGFAVILDSPDRAELLHVPVGYDNVRWFGPVPPRCSVHAVRRSAAGAELLVADVAIADEFGSVVMRIDGLQLRAVADDAAHLVPPVAVEAGSRGSDLLGMIDRIGLHPDEGIALLDRLIGSDSDRIIVSAVDLDALRDMSLPDDPSDLPPVETGGSSGTTYEERLTTMWQELLGIDEIGQRDDFFDLGGHSLIAIRLMTRIKRELGVRFQLSTIFEASTIEALAALVRAELPDGEGQSTTDATLAATSATERPSRQIVTISNTGDRTPLYIVHGAGGNVLFLWSLARALGGDRPIHGFQAHGVNEGELPDTSIEAMARRYVTELRAHSTGPYLLGGYSGGGIVTLEMVRQLQELGESVQHVILFDSVPTGKAWPGRSDRWRRLIGHARSSGVSAVVPYVRSSLLEWVRKYVPEPDTRRRDHEQQDRALGYTDVGDQGFVNLYYYFSATADRHQTGNYDVDATIIKAGRVWAIQPDDYHWGKHITGTLDWHISPGDHHSMFYPENAPALAGIVRDVLDRVENAAPRED